MDGYSRWIGVYWHGVAYRSFQLAFFSSLVNVEYLDGHVGKAVVSRKVHDGFLIPTVPTICSVG